MNALIASHSVSRNICLMVRELYKKLSAVERDVDDNRIGDNMKRVIERLAKLLARGYLH